MNKHSRILVCTVAISVAVVSGSFAQLTSKSFEPVTVGRLSSTPDVEKLGRVIKQSLLHYGWRIDGEESGGITATYSKDAGSISATICIAYSSEGYTISYVESKGLNADLSAKKIHRNYVRWIANLDKTIAEEYVGN